MMSLRQLEYLLAVVDAGSFTRAATRLHVTQPALSHQIRALEQHVGGRLLDRLPRSVRPTPMGRALLPHARAALADAERARTAARRAAGLEGGELELATVYSVALGVLPPVLRAWHRAHPDVRVRLIEHRHADELAEASADVVVGPRSPDPAGAVHPLGTEEFVLVLPPDDPAASGTGRLDLAELADRQWVHYAPGHGLADLLDRACSAAGFTPSPAVRTEQTATAPVLAAAGLGPTLTPANIVGPAFDGALRWPDPPITRELVASAAAEPDPITAAFLDTLTAHARPRPAHPVAPPPAPSRHPPIRL